MTVKNGKKSVNKMAVKNTINTGVSLVEGMIAFENNSKISKTSSCCGLKRGIG